MEFMTKMKLRMEILISLLFFLLILIFHDKVHFFRIINLYNYTYADLASMSKSKIHGADYISIFCTHIYYQKLTT